MFNQVLATGVHGVLLTHADDPGAVRAFVEACRFPIHHQGVGQNGLKEGRRGVHGNPTAAPIWGVSQEEYEQKADTWPLNPNGELLLGLKLEDKYALVNANANLQIPGIAFAEWGPGDMALSLGVAQGYHQRSPHERRPLHRLRRLQSQPQILPEHLDRTDVIDMIKEGVMMGPASQATAEVGRKYTKRQSPLVNGFTSASGPLWPSFLNRGRAAGGASGVSMSSIAFQNPPASFL